MEISIVVVRRMTRVTIPTKQSRRASHIPVMTQMKQRAIPASPERGKVAALRSVGVQRGVGSYTGRVNSRIDPETLWSVETPDASFAAGLAELTADHSAPPHVPRRFRLGIVLGT